MFYFTNYVFLYSISSICCINIDTKFPILFSYQNQIKNQKSNDSMSSYFGYSLVANRQNGQN